MSVTLVASPNFYWTSCNETKKNFKRNNGSLFHSNFLLVFFEINIFMSIFVAVAASWTVKSTVNPTRILRKLRSNAAESVEEGTSCASGGVSSPGSGRSRSSNRSAELTRKVSCLIKIHFYKIILFNSCLLLFLFRHSYLIALFLLSNEAYLDKSLWLRMRLHFTWVIFYWFLITTSIN